MDFLFVCSHNKLLLLSLLLVFLQGYELNGMRLAVRFPDRIPNGLGISSSALISEEEANMRLVLQ